MIKLITVNSKIPTQYCNMENKLRVQCIPSVLFNRKMVVDTKNTFFYLKKSFTGPWMKVIFNQNLQVFEPSPPGFLYIQVDMSDGLISVHIFYIMKERVEQ